MRENKFRAWHTGKKVMFSPEEMGYDQLTLMPNGKGFINVSGDSTRLSQLMPHMIPMQYTGLHDKNGKEIYEGDIIHLEGQKHNHKIIYTISSFVGKQTKGKFLGYLDGLFFYRTEVIGNIYENKELLNADKR